jgi:hypothetical protein
MPEGLSPSEVGKVRAARMGLISIGGVILVLSSISLILAPKPPV